MRSFAVSLYALALINAAFSAPTPANVRSRAVSCGRRGGDNDVDFTTRPIGERCRFRGDQGDDEDEFGSDRFGDDQFRDDQFRGDQFRHDGVGSQGGDRHDDNKTVGDKHRGAKQSDSTKSSDLKSPESRGQSDDKQLNPRDDGNDSSWDGPGHDKYDGESEEGKGDGGEDDYGHPADDTYSPYKKPEKYSYQPKYQYKKPSSLPAYTSGNHGKAKAAQSSRTGDNIISANLGGLGEILGPSNPNAQANNIPANANPSRLTNSDVRGARGGAPGGNTPAGPGRAAGGPRGAVQG